MFEDIRSIDPGTTFKGAMDKGVDDAAVFCLFVSPTSIAKTWVDYEVELARLQASRGALEVLVIPIKGKSYADAPAWMQAYMAISTDFTPFDIARTIRGLHDGALRGTRGHCCGTV